MNCSRKVVTCGLEIMVSKCDYTWCMKRYRPKMICKLSYKIDIKGIQFNVVFG